MLGGGTKMTSEGIKHVGRLVSSLALVISSFCGAVSFRDSYKNTKIIGIGGRRYFSSNYDGKITLSWNVSPFCHINLVDENLDGCLDYKDVTMIGPRPSGGGIRAEPTLEDQVLYDEFLEGKSNGNE